MKKISGLINIFFDVIEKDAAEKSRGQFVFPKDHPKVKDDKDHFPINTLGRARNALARANQFSSAPTWYSGTLQSFVNSVVRAVKKEYPSIEVSEEASKPGKKTAQVDIIGDGWQVGQTITDVLTISDVVNLLQQLNKDTTQAKNIHTALINKFYEVHEKENRKMTKEEQENFVRNYS